MIDKLTHKSILKAMFKDDMITVAEAKRIDVNLMDPGAKEAHPVVGISRSLPTHQKTGNKISLDALCQWFAEQLDVNYFNIDPLKIDIASVTQVVAPQYARQHGFLAVAADKDMVTLAAKNPLDLSWKEGLEKLLRKQIRIVFALSLIHI